MKAGLLSFVVSVMAATFIVVSCSRKPTEPVIDDYVVYAGFSGHGEPCDDTAMHRIYVYDADSLQLTDSILTEVFVKDIEVSPDGRWLYVESNGLDKIDAATKQIVWSLPEIGGGHQLLKNGAIILRDVHDRFTLLRASDGGLIRDLPDTVSYHHGPEGGTKIAVEAHGPVRKLSVLDVETGVSYGNWIPTLTSGGNIIPVYAVLHPDGRRVAVIGDWTAGLNAIFAVGDVLTGETLLEHRLIYPFGEITISDDGRTALVTDPSRFLINDSYSTLDLFDLDQNVHVKRFDYQREGGNPADSVYIIGQARFVPGGDHVVAAAEAGLYKGVGPLYWINLSRLVVEKTVFSPLHHPYLPDGGQYPECAYVGGIAVGRRP